MITWLVILTLVVVLIGACLIGMLLRVNAFAKQSNTLLELFDGLRRQVERRQ